MIFTRAALVSCSIMLLAVGSACKSKSETDGKSAEVSAETTEPTKPVTPAKALPVVAEPVELKDSGEEWIPQEHTEGMKIFRDPGVYVDGKPIGMLKWAEMPISLKPFWRDEEAAIPFKKGQPETKLVKKRGYLFLDYFKAQRIDIKRIKEVHLYGGSKRYIALVVTGDSFRKSKGFGFRFGSDVFGKAIPACPEQGFADASCPDNINAVVAYIDKDPPERRGGHFFLEDKKVVGIPYYGLPVRGGVRVYLDGPFAAHVKRHKLEEVQDKEGVSIVMDDGKRKFNFFAFLETQNVDTSKVKQAWLVHNNRFVREISRKDLEKATFIAAERKSGQILFGDEQVACNAIHLQTKPVSAKNIPQPRPHERLD